MHECAMGRASIVPWDRQREKSNPACYFQCQHISCRFYIANAFYITHMRPCLISDWRRKPMVASLPCPQKFLSARLRGS